MVEIHPNVFVGNQDDYEHTIKPKQSEWRVVHACKEPYHRQILGYTGRAAPKDHPEYLFAVRGNRLALNLVDVDDPGWISPIIINKAIQFIDDAVSEGKPVLIHCNQGMSRSAGIGLLYLAHIGLFDGKSFRAAEAEFALMYPAYCPAFGIRGFIERNWSEYRTSK